jgi:hypothetical protein
MSRPARWVLGSFSLLFAAAFAMSVANSPEPLFLWLCAAFCMLIALGCFSQVARGPAIRVIGATVFAIYAAYAAQEIAKAWGKPFNVWAHEHWISAVEGLITFGLPGVYVALRGRYPKWGKAAPAFLAKESREVSDPNRPIIP